MNTILVIGSANVDTVYTVHKIPAPGETIMATDVMQNAGGKGANQAVAAAKAGAPVSFAGALGRDAGGEMLRRSLQAAGVDTRNARETDSPTGSAFICVTASTAPEAGDEAVAKGENSIVVYKGANDALTPEMASEALAGLNAGDICIMQLEVPLHTVLSAISECARRGVRVLLNPSPVLTNADAMAQLRLALRNVDILVPNYREAETLLGAQPNAEALRVFCADTGLSRVVMTMGDRGVWSVSAETAEFYPCSAVEAVDTTGAGDCFLGALAASMARGETVDAAIRYAMAASAIAVTRMGAQQSMPTRAEVLMSMK